MSLHALFSSDLIPGLWEDDAPHLQCLAERQISTNSAADILEGNPLRLIITITV